MGRRGRQLRPFCFKARVEPRGYSGPLQRVLTDFGAEQSFARAAAQVKEHYDIDVPVSAVRQATYAHARKILQVNPPVPREPAKILITQIDGSMIPLVQPGAGTDRRKQKTTSWNEVRLCCARAQGQVRTVYGATLGSLETACLLWRLTAQQAGLSEKTFVHGIGDGAPWIVDRFKENFGQQGKYLIDFYHVSEYLAAAALSIAGEKKAATWLHKQKGKLVAGEAAKLLRTLEPHMEAQGQAETPVQDAHRYIRQRLQHLHYDQALRANLPIGSGQVESGHRHVIQHRLKLAGAWWKETNAQAMLSLRVSRANGCWDKYWAQN